MHKTIITITTAFVGILLTACGSKGIDGNNKIKELTFSNVKPEAEARTFVHQEGNAVYYWKTVLDMNSTDYQFLKRHKVEKVYLRFFDIVPDKSALATDDVIPNATMQVKDSVELQYVVPTVYITLDALEKMEGNEGDWAQKIVDRVSNMCQYYNLGTLNELQLDCDWTGETESIYFELCRKVKEVLLDKNSEAGISSTIRLHQLYGAAPPVDYGVLMLYNTGSFKNIDTDNSILSTEDVKPYLKYLDRYPLHLDFAYPSYTWNLMYRDGKFLGILRSNLADFGASLRKVSYNRYVVKEDVIVSDMSYHKGDIIRCESSPYSTIIATKELIDAHLKSKNHSNIIYHYESRNLSKYTDAEIAAIFFSN